MDKNSIQLTDLLVTFGLALMTNCLAEALSFVLIYRKKKYKELSRNIEGQAKKIEGLKENLSTTINQSDKKVKKLEADMKGLNFEMMKLRMASTFIIGLFMIFFMSIFNSVYQVSAEFDVLLCLLLCLYYYYCYTTITINITGNTIF